MKRIFLLFFSLFSILVIASAVATTLNLSFASIGMQPITTPVFLSVTSLVLLGIAWLTYVKYNQLSNHFYSLQRLQHYTLSDLATKQLFGETLFLHAHTGIATINLEGRFLRVNHAFCELLGYSQTEILAMNLYFLINPVNLNTLQLAVQDLLDQKAPFHQSEYQVLRKNTETLWMMMTLSLIRDENNSPQYYIMQVEDISLQKRAEERLRHMAYHDPLTGLANRNKLEQFISHILATSRRHNLGFALLFLDIDHFKTVNDTISHEAGDTVLQIIAERIKNSIRNTDLVARLGGDEFVILISDVAKTEAAAVIAQKILRAMTEVIIVKGQEIYLSSSIGISIYPLDGHNMQTLMKNADLALFRAKEQGRNNYQFYTAEMTLKARERLALQNALAHALVKNEFVLHYQPKMELKTRKIVGVEALLRWNNKEYGFITPSEIVALAEESGLIIPVSDWIIRTACKQLKKWQQMGLTTLTMSINCSPKQFKQANFVDELINIVNLTGVSAQLIEIEVKESTIMVDPENTLRALYALKDVGMKIAIDDFGTGYWSISNLKRLAVDKIKIDKIFTKNMCQDEMYKAITCAVIALINRLGIISLAEGVETREQYEFLMHEDCKEIQGYYLTQPLTDDEMTKFLKHPIPDAEVVNKIETTNLV